MTPETANPPPNGLPRELCCPVHQAPLVGEAAPPSGEGEIRGTCGCIFPVRKGIPRFAQGDAYAESFGLQWNAFRATQLDSYSQTTISRDRLTRCLGGSLDLLRGATVLEVGCGAGRFTEILLDAGAWVLACDLSAAVEANKANCGGRPGHFVCQADVRRLPVVHGSFDFVIALGMVQHTPSPERSIQALARAVRPGGVLVLDHYRRLSPLLAIVNAVTPRSVMRRILLRLPSAVSFRVTERITRTLLPVHRALWRRGPVVDRVRAVWRLMSPVFDYYDRFPELGESLADWARLDTHDALTDYYKHFRSPVEIRTAMQAAGLEVIACGVGGNGVEARGRRPMLP